jgi:hypothetical protein
MRVIHKYPLSSPWQAINMPRMAQIIAVQTQRSNICLWAMFDAADAEQLEERVFAIHGTGRIEIEARETYVGTVQQGPYAWHVFEVKA